MSFIIFKGLSVAKNGNRPGSVPLGSLEIFFESLYAPYVYSVFFGSFVLICYLYLRVVHIFRPYWETYRMSSRFECCFVLVFRIVGLWVLVNLKYTKKYASKTHRSITIRKWIIPKSFVKFSSTPILKNICERLLLSFMLEKNAGVLLCSIVLETCLQKLITGFNVRQLDILKYFRIIFSLKKANYPIFVFV